MNDAKIDWIDLSAYGAKMFSAKFAEQSDRYILIEADDEIPYRSRIAMKRSGFLRLGNFYFLKADSISLSRIEGIFPEAHPILAPLKDTRVLISDPYPDVLFQRFSSKTSRLELENSGLKMLNSFQAAYEPKSSGGTPIAAIPLQLAAGTTKALNAVADRHGDIDDWLCKELDYPNIEEMAAVLSPEQIDAVALAIDNAYEGSGSICADQTGLGKGRVGAALARWASLNGRTFVFLTEKANLFTDFVRDIIDIKSQDIIGAPFIMNNGTKILDQATNEVIYSSLPPKSLKEVISSRKLPEGVNMVMGTYSQLNRKGSEKSEFFVDICRGAHLHSDESHNAAGEASNTNLAVMEAMGHARSYSYSSATHAKRAANMSVYAPLLPPSMSSQENMLDVLDAGGMPLLETLSQMLAETGRLIRREHDLSDMKIPLLLDHKRKHLHEAHSDLLAPILSEISMLSRDIGNWLEEKTNSPEAKKAKEQWYAVHWGVRFSAVVNQFIAACKIDYSVERAVAALQRDEKPVFVVQNTMEAVLREIMGDPDDKSVLRQKIVDEDGTERLPEFKDVLSLLVDRTLTARVKKGSDEPVTVNIEDPEMVERAEVIRSLISGFPKLPISPMDEISQRIESEGARLFSENKISRAWKGGEISARKVKVTDEGVVQTQEIDRNISINDFQNGASDFIILTKAASTGLSLHANPRSEDKRVRHMMEFQIPNNPVERVQFWGRIKRRGGINEPKFSCLATAMSMELRSLAAQNKKIEELSANVSGSRDAGIKLDVPDPINSIGDKVAKRVLLENPQVAHRMGISLKVDDEQSEEELYYVNRLLSRLALVKSVERDAIYFTFLEAYEETLSDLAAKGIHPTRPRELPGEWMIAAREVFSMGSELDGPVFGAPVYLTTLRREEYVYPIDKSTLLEILEDRKKGEAALAETSEIILKYLKDNQGEIFKKVLPKKYRSVIEALNTRENNRVKMEAEKTMSIQRFMRHLKIGGEATMSGDNEEAMTAVVLGVKTPSSPDDYSKPGLYFLEYLLPGDEAPRRTSLATLNGDPNFKIAQRPNDFEYDYKPFDGHPAGRVVRERKVLDGNIFSAAQISVHRNLGATTRITLTTGEQVSGVMIPINQQDMISTIPGMTTDPHIAHEIMDRGGELYTNPAHRDEGMVINKDGPTIKVSIPGKKKLAKPFEIPEITSIIGELKGDWGGKVGWISESDFFKLAEVLRSRGSNFNFAGGWRSTAIELAVEAEKNKDKLLENNNSF